MKTQKTVSKSGTGTRGLTIKWTDVQMFAVKITHRFRPECRFCSSSIAAPPPPRILIVAQ